MLLENKFGIVFGVANKRSIAWATARACLDAGARLEGHVKASVVSVGGELIGNIENAKRVELLETGVRVVVNVAPSQSGRAACPSASTIAVDFFDLKSELVKTTRLPTRTNLDEWKLPKWDASTSAKSLVEIQRLSALPPTFTWVNRAVTRRGSVKKRQWS